MIYAVFFGLFLFSFFNVLNSFLRGRSKGRIDIIIGFVLVSLIGYCFWAYGWKYGVSALAFAWVSAMITAWPAQTLAQKLLDYDWVTSKMEGVAKYIPSSLALLYPIAATIWISTTPATTTEVVGYGTANLGYLLLGAGTFAGTFTLFNLTKRWQVYTVGAFFVIVGMAIVNA